MKNRNGVVILMLIVICLGLGVILITSKRKAAGQLRQDAGQISELSNHLVAAKNDLKDLTQRSTMIERDLEGTRKAFGELTNNFTQVAANLNQASTTLAKTEAALKATEEEVKKRDTRIAELESQNQALDKKAQDLGNAITNLTAQINETKRKLTASEGDRVLMESNLRRLIAEKSELERQFNDLTILRAQVSKLKEELTIARRQEWIRQGLFSRTEQKGAQRLMQGAGTHPEALAPKPNYNLNVELGSDGSAKIVPPLTNAPSATNAPPPTNPPAK